MSIGSVSLTASARANLLSLQSTASLLGVTQSHLASGKKINTALDGASSYFQSQGFLNTANDLSSLKDGLATSLQTIKAASDAITSISTVVNQLQAVVTSALQATDSTVRANLATQYNGLLSQLDSLANDATFNGTNLVNGVVQQLKVIFNTTNTSNLTIGASNLTSTGLGVGAAVGSFASGALAKQVTSNLTVATNNTALTNVAYSGALSGLSVSSAVATSGNGATVTSNSTNFTDGAKIAGAAALATNAEAVLGTNAAAISGITQSSYSQLADTADSTVRTVISGQFTVSGGSNATYAVGTNTLTAGATNSTGLTISIGAGQSVKLDKYDGTNRTTTVYTNTGTSAVTFNAGATTDTVTANNSLSYTFPAGTGVVDGTATNVTGTVVTSSAAVATPSTTLSTFATLNAGGAAAVTAGLVQGGGQLFSLGSGNTTNQTITNINAVTGFTQTAAAVATTTGSNAAGNEEVTVTGKFTATAGAAATYADGGVLTAGAAGATGLVISVAAGDTIQVKVNAHTGGAGSVINYTNTTNGTLSFNAGVATATLQGNATGTHTGASATYNANDTTSYVLQSGVVSPTGVKLSNSATINGSALVDSQSQAVGGSVSVTTTTAAAAGATAGTTTQSSITAYDVGSATVASISGTGVTATLGATGSTTYAGSNLSVNLTGVKTLTGNSTTVIADAVTTAQNQLSAALTTLRAASSSLGNNNTVVQTRSDFTTNLINTLQTASDNLVLADTNEEGANLQALQARNQLGVVSLGISGQLAQSILKLF